MIRLNALVEGQTEEAFFNRVLIPHLAEQSVFCAVQMVSARPRRPDRKHKGGWNSYAKAKEHLLRWHRSDPNPNVWFTTMFDLYAIPDDFPGLEDATTPDPLSRVQSLERAFFDDMTAASVHRFVPHLQLHEFEALVLCDADELKPHFLEQDKAISKIRSMAASFESPEHINNGAETAPSKRIIAELPEYAGRKVSVGPLIVDAIGMTRLRSKCVHFSKWIDSLESLPTR